MQEIKCPNCGQVFKVDESGYASILKQVRDHEFEEELKAREEADLKVVRMEQEHVIEQLKAQLLKADTEKELAVTKATQEKEKELSEKNSEIVKLRSDLDLQKKEGELQKNNLVEKHRKGYRPCWFLSDQTHKWCRQ